MEREWWLKLIVAKFNNLISGGSWKFVPPICATSSERKLVGTKIAFKKKEKIDRNICFKRRHVTLGFAMVTRAKFAEIFSLVATDESHKNQVAIALKK